MLAMKKKVMQRFSYDSISFSKQIVFVAATLFQFTDFNFDSRRKAEA